MDRESSTTTHSGSNDAAVASAMRYLESAVCDVCLMASIASILREREEEGRQDEELTFAIFNVENRLSTLKSQFLAAYQGKVLELRLTEWVL